MMKMNLQSFLLLMILILPTFLIGQTEQKKQEVYNQLLELRIRGNKQYPYKERFKEDVVSFIDSLESNGIDTIGIYRVDYVGFISYDTCSNYLGEPKYIYIQWRQNGASYHKNFNSTCNANTLQIEKSSIISYYLANTSLITKSIIMPCIIEIKDNTITSSDISHDIGYTIYCRIRGKEYFDFFWDNDLICKENLYYEENQNSIINQWMKEIDKQIEKVENQD